MVIIGEFPRRLCSPWYVLIKNWRHAVLKVNPIVYIGQNSVTGFCFQNEGARTCGGNTINWCCISQSHLHTVERLLQINYYLSSECILSFPRHPHLQGQAQENEATQNLLIHLHLVYKTHQAFLPLSSTQWSEAKKFLNDTLKTGI